jgi:hypothetical protein
MSRFTGVRTVSGTSDQAIIDDLMRHLEAPRSRGNRYKPETRKWAFELLRTCGSKALDLVRQELPLPSRQALCCNPPKGYEPSDLTDPNLIAKRIKEWRRRACAGGYRWEKYPRCVIASDALAFRPSVEVTNEKLTGVDLTDLEFDGDVLQELTSSSTAFADFVSVHWKSILHAAFVYQLQPLDPNLDTCVLFVHGAPDGKARARELAMLKQIKEIASRKHVTIGAFATDGDSGYDPKHTKNFEANMDVLKKTHNLPTTQKFRSLSDILHALKRARYRMLSDPPMVVGLLATDQMLDVQILRDLFRGDLPAIVFCNDPITKMHDSLPMVLFRFECLVKIYEAGHWEWVAYFFPWVLINEAMSHKKVRTVDRLSWLRLAYYYLMKCSMTYTSQPLGPGVSFFGRKKSEGAARRTLFDQKLLMHTTNSIAGIVIEIHQAKRPISLQRLMTVPVEKKFGVTRLHAKTHQTMLGLVRAMEQDEAMKFAYALQAVKNRRLAYGETVEPCTQEWDMRYDPLVFVEALLQFLAFPAPMWTLGPLNEDTCREYVDILISDELLPFAKTNFSAMSGRKRRSLYQELAGVITSSRRIIMSSKSEMGAVVGARSSHPVERHLANLLGRNRILSWELKAIIEQVCQAAHVGFEGPHPLNRSTKRDLIQWIETNWPALGELFTSITANQNQIQDLAHGVVASHLPAKQFRKRRARKN